MIYIRANLRDSTRITAAGDIRSAKGPFLYSCNQCGDNIAVFRVNRKTGGLVFTGHYTPVGNPSIIVLLDLAKEDIVRRSAGLRPAATSQVRTRPN